MYMEKKSTKNIVKKSRAQLRFSKGKGKAVILMVIKMFCKEMTRLNPLIEERGKTVSMTGGMNTLLFLIQKKK